MPRTNRWSPIRRPPDFCHLRELKRDSGRVFVSGVVTHHANCSRRGYGQMSRLLGLGRRPGSSVGAEAIPKTTVFETDSDRVRRPRRGLSTRSILRLSARLSPPARASRMAASVVSFDTRGSNSSAFSCANPSSTIRAHFSRNPLFGLSRRGKGRHYKRLVHEGMERAAVILGGGCAGSCRFSRSSSSCWSGSGSV